MKKRWIIVVVLICILILGVGFFGCQRYRTLVLELNEEKMAYPEIYDTLDAVTLDTFVRKMNEKEDFVVYVGRPTCPDCSSFEPQFIELLEEAGVASKIYYLNVAKISKEEDKWRRFKETYDIQYVPTIAKVENGKVVEKVGWTPEDGIDIEKIKEYLLNLRTYK